MDDNAIASTSSFIEVLSEWKSGCLDEAQPPLKTQEDLQISARTFFEKISDKMKIVTDSGVVLETRSSHEEALAKLIQDLGPAFSTTRHQSRVRALHVLAGAVGGCKNKHFSNSITNLIGTFLIRHCGPIEDDVYGEDYDSMIRDAAMLGLTSLAETPSSATTDVEISEALKLRMDFSLKGVNHRCAAPEMEEDEDISGYGTTTRNIQDIRGGLSTLPRSKRSLCFGLLQGAVTGISSITSDMQSTLTKNLLSSLQTQIVEFVRFAANCLHGESDPRCLMQLLALLHSTQVTFVPFFSLFTSSNNLFPTEEIFDAVAPYYPIQFTPPPNNIHGITREGLHKALVSVLVFTEMDHYAQKHHRHTMLGLSAGLFLEQLLPMHAEDAPSTIERLEALDCLSLTLFPDGGRSLCERLDVQTVRTLSSAMKATHDESSLGVSQGGDKGEQNKQLADTCRTFISNVAFQLELASNKALWEAFVSEMLQKQVSQLNLSPDHSKTTIAYIACLTASGGPRTLRSCLALGLDPLVKFIGQSLDDTEDTAAAAHGIGALFSSCRVAMERAAKEGVVLHPHPLEPYAESTCQVLLDAFESEDEKLSLTTRIGVVRGLECLILASSSAHLSTPMIERICSFLDHLLGTCTNQRDVPDEWKSVCAVSLGSILGAALESSSNSEANALVSNGQILDCVEKRVYPCLLDCSTMKAQGSKECWARKALAIACSSSQSAACSVVTSILQSLTQALQVDILDPSCMRCADALSFVLRNGSDFCVQAYHNTSEAGAIIQILSDGMQSRNNGELRGSVANLALPATAEEQEALSKEIDNISRIVGNLLPAYKRFVPRSCLADLVKGVSNIIPPLSEADNFSLCVKLPILGAALRSSVNGKDSAGMKESDESIEEITGPMLAGLTEYVLSTEYDVRPRSAAASCIHATISLTVSSDECTVVPLAKNILNPAMVSSSDASSIKHQLNLLALLGSAAACRGGSSSSTADKIARFLVALAAKTKPVLPFSSESDKYLDLEKFDAVSVESLQLAAASAYGSMLSVEGVKPLMKQRLTYASFKYTRSTYEKFRDQAMSGQAVVALDVGLLAVVCHVICCNDLSRIDRTTQHQLAFLVIEGLSSIPTIPNTENQSSIKLLVLAAVLKLICVAPSSVPLNGFLMTLVTGLLRAYAISDPSSEVACKLLALQALEGMARMEGAKVSAITVRPAVVEVLASAMNHPSGLLRQAAVDVRNAWYVLD